jgi:hypothetical protein
MYRDTGSISQPGDMDMPSGISRAGKDTCIRTGTGMAGTIAAIFHDGGRTRCLMETSATRNFRSPQN